MKKPSKEKIVYVDLSAQIVTRLPFDVKLNFKTAAARQRVNIQHLVTVLIERFTCYANDPIKFTKTDGVEVAKLFEDIVTMAKQRRVEVMSARLR